MTSLVRRFAVLLVVLPFLPNAGAALPAAEPPAPTDAELTRYIAIQNALAVEAERPGDLCEALAGDGEEDGEASLAAVARRAEAHPLLGPVLRRQSLSGRRFVEITAQVTAVLLGAAIAEATDAASGGSASLDTLRASSPAAAPILARRAELSAALEAVGAACGGGGE